MSKRTANGPYMKERRARIRSLDGGSNIFRLYEDGSLDIGTDKDVALGVYMFSPKQAAKIHALFQPKKKRSAK